MCLAMGSLGSTSLSLFSMVLKMGLLAICRRADAVLNGAVIMERAMGTTTLIAIFLVLSMRVYYLSYPMVG